MHHPLCKMTEWDPKLVSVQPVLPSASETSPTVLKRVHVEVAENVPQKKTQKLQQHGTALAEQQIQRQQRAAAQAASSRSSARSQQQHIGAGCRRMGQAVAVCSPGITTPTFDHQIENVGKPSAAIQDVASGPCSVFQSVLEAASTCMPGSCAVFQQVLALLLQLVATAPQDAETGVTAEDAAAAAALAVKDLSSKDFQAFTKALVFNPGNLTAFVKAMCSDRSIAGPGILAGIARQWATEAPQQAHAPYFTEQLILALHQAQNLEVLFKANQHSNNNVRQCACCLLQSTLDAIHLNTTVLPREDISSFLKSHAKELLQPFQTFVASTEMSQSPAMATSKRASNAAAALAILSRTKPGVEAILHHNLSTVWQAIELPAVESGSQSKWHATEEKLCLLEVLHNIAIDGVYGHQQVNDQLHWLWGLIVQNNMKCPQDQVLAISACKVLTVAISDSSTRNASRSPQNRPCLLHSSLSRGHVHALLRLLVSLLLPLTQQQSLKSVSSFPSSVDEGNMCGCTSVETVVALLSTMAEASGGALLAGVEVDHDCWGLLHNLVMTVFPGNIPEMFKPVVKLLLLATAAVPASSGSSQPLGLQQQLSKKLLLLLPQIAEWVLPICLDAMVSGTHRTESPAAVSLAATCAMGQTILHCAGAPWVVALTVQSLVYVVGQLWQGGKQAAVPGFLLMLGVIAKSSAAGHVKVLQEVPPLVKDIFRLQVEDIDLEALACMVALLGVLLQPVAGHSNRGSTPFSNESAALPAITTELADLAGGITIDCLVASMLRLLLLPSAELERMQNAYDCLVCSTFADQQSWLILCCPSLETSLLTVLTSAAKAAPGALCSKLLAGHQPEALLCGLLHQLLSSCITNSAAVYCGHMDLLVFLNEQLVKAGDRDAVDSLVKALVGEVKGYHQGLAAAAAAAAVAALSCLAAFASDNIVSHAAVLQHAGEELLPLLLQISNDETQLALSTAVCLVFKALLRPTGFPAPSWATGAAPVVTKWAQELVAAKDTLPALLQVAKLEQQQRQQKQQPQSGERAVGFQALDKLAAAGHSRWQWMLIKLRTKSTALLALQWLSTAAPDQMCQRLVDASNCNNDSAEQHVLGSFVQLAVGSKQGADAVASILHDMCLACTLFLNHVNVFAGGVEWHMLTAAGAKQQQLASCLARAVYVQKLVAGIISWHSQMMACVVLKLASASQTFKIGLVPHVGSLLEFVHAHKEAAAADSAALLVAKLCEMPPGRFVMVTSPTWLAMVVDLARLSFSVVVPTASQISYHASCALHSIARSLEGQQALLPYLGQLLADDDVEWSTATGDQAEQVFSAVERITAGSAAGASAVAQHIDPIIKATARGGTHPEAATAAACVIAHLVQQPQQPTQVTAAHRLPAVLNALLQLLQEEPGNVTQQTTQQAAAGIAALAGQASTARQALAKPALVQQLLRQLLLDLERSSWDADPWLAAHHAVHLLKAVRLLIQDAAQVGAQSGFSQQLLQLMLDTSVPRSIIPVLLSELVLPLASYREGALDMYKHAALLQKALDVAVREGCADILRSDFPGEFPLPATNDQWPVAVEDILQYLLVNGDLAYEGLQQDAAVAALDLRQATLQLAQASWDHRQVASDELQGSAWWHNMWRRRFCDRSRVSSKHVTAAPRCRQSWHIAVPRPDGGAAYMLLPCPTYYSLNLQQLADQGLQCKHMIFLIIIFVSCLCVCVCGGGCRRLWTAFLIRCQCGQVNGQVGSCSGMWVCASSQIGVMGCMCQHFVDNKM